MNPESSNARPPCTGIEREEEKAWVGFYRRVHRSDALATEVLSVLEADALLKRRHSGLYLCCKEALRDHTVRQARDARLGQGIRKLTSVLVLRLPLQAAASVGRALQRIARVGAATLSPQATRTEPAPAPAPPPREATEPSTAQVAVPDASLVPVPEPAHVVLDHLATDPDLPADHAAFKSGQAAVVTPELQTPVSRPVPPASATSQRSEGAAARQRSA